MAAFDLTAFLDKVCAENGAIGIGLGAGADSKNTPDFCIPVPRNINRALGPLARANVAAWAAEKVMGTMFSEGSGVTALRKQYLAVNAWACYMVGGVHIKGNPFTEAQSGETWSAAKVEGLAWDTEVKVFDEDCTFTTNPPPIPQVIRDRRDDIAKIITLDVAAKITWFTTKHHLGARIAGNAPGRRYQGFTEKTVGVVALPEISMDSSANISFVHQLIHPWSTIAMMRDLRLGANGSEVSVDDLRETCDVVRDA